MWVCQWGAGSCQLSPLSGWRPLRSAPSCPPYPHGPAWPPSGAPSATHTCRHSSCQSPHRCQSSHMWCAPGFRRAALSHHKHGTHPSSPLLLIHKKSAFCFIWLVLLIPLKEKFNLIIIFGHYLASCWSKSVCCYSSVVHNRHTFF